MKHFTLATFFIITIALLNPCILYATEKTVSSYVYPHIFPSQQSLPAAEHAQKKIIIFELDGILCKTNHLQALYEIGIELILQYIAHHGKPSLKKLFQALEDIPALSTCHAFHQGMQMPQILVDLQCHAQNIQDIQDAMINHILHAKELTIREKNLFVSAILLVTTPEKFIATRQPILAGIELARTLKKRGYKLYILSNWDALSFPLLKKQFPELFFYEEQNLFEGIMISGIAGIVKPNPDLFKIFLQRFKIDKAQAIFIDSTHENIITAQNLGIDTIYCPDKNIHALKQQLILKLKLS